MSVRLELLKAEFRIGATLPPRPKNNSFHAIAIATWWTTGLVPRPLTRRIPENLQHPPALNRNAEARPDPPNSESPFPDRFDPELGPVQHLDRLVSIEAPSSWFFPFLVCKGRSRVTQSSRQRLSRRHQSQACIAVAMTKLRLPVVALLAILSTEPAVSKTVGIMGDHR